METKTVLITVLGALTTVFGAWLGYLAVTRSKKTEGETSFQTELVKEFSKLTATLSSLNADMTKLHGELRGAQISQTEFEIRVERNNARIQEFVDLIQRMLEVKDCWNSGNEREAKRLLELVERDRRESEKK